MSPEEIAALAKQMGVDPALLTSMLSGGAAGPEGPVVGNDLVAALIGSAMDVTGRYGQTGHRLSGSIPPWAAGLAQPILDSPDFDPYYGIVSQQGDEQVYMGSRTRQKTTPGTPPNKFAAEYDPASIQDETTEVVSDKRLTALAASNLPYSWDQDEVHDAMDKMKDAGLLKSTATFDDMVQAWGGLVNRAAQTYAATEGKRKVTPWDVLDLYKSEAEKSGLLDELNGSRTTVSRNITEIDEGEAWASLQGAVSQLLGKDPTDQDVRDFTYRMGQLAARTPSVSKVVSQYKDGSEVSRTTHTTPGFTASDMAHEAYDSALNDPEHAEYSAASTYFNAAMSALGPLGG